MPLLVNSVPNLVQGVSQQPDSLRHPAQSDEQINAFSSVVEGLIKRPSTEFVSKLYDDNTNASSLFTHFVKRDENTKYCVTVSLGNSVSIGQVGVIDLETGTSISVAVTSIATSYLSGISNPLADLKALTVADYTFLVNKKKTVRRNRIKRTEDFRNLEDPDNPRYEALIYPKIGDYEKAYSIYIDDSLVGVGSTLQGSEHDYDQINQGHTNSVDDVQTATYISGNSGDAVRHADTEFIAKHLLEILEDWLPDSSVPDSVISFSLDSVNQGEGFEDSGVAPSSLDANGVLGAFGGSVLVKYEFNILQYDSSGTLYGDRTAGGGLVMESGSISSFHLYRRGRGYRTAQAGDVFELEIIKYEFEQSPKSTIAAAFSSFSGARSQKLRKTVYNRDTVSNFPDITMPDITATVGTANFTAERNGSVIKVSSDFDFNIRVEDGLASQGLGLAYKEVDSITDLPKNCYNNFKIKVRGDADINQDDYYVRFQTKGREDFGSGAYVETVGWKANVIKGEDARGIPYLIEPSTMPIVLIKQSDGTFVLQTPNERANFVKHNSTIYKIVENHVSDTDNEPGVGADWREYWIETTEVSTANAWQFSKNYNVTGAGWGSRSAGDEGTNPFPSFTDNSINDVFFFKNRLGFLTDSSVIFSEADEYFNFFRATTQQLLDSAPIDVGLSHTKVARLKYVKTFQEKLMLFSDTSQFTLRGADILSPKTVAISPVSEYDVSDVVEPLALGNYIYFPFKRDKYEGVYEYFVDNNTEVFTAQEITEQVPKYIRSNVIRMAGSSIQNVLVLQSDRDDSVLYIYKYFWSNNEKVQSAWQRFDLRHCNIRGFEFIDSILYLVTEVNDTIQLEKLSFEDAQEESVHALHSFRGNLGYPLLLDSKVVNDAASLSPNMSSSYDATANLTTITGIDIYIPPAESETTLELWTTNGKKYDVTRVSDTSVEFEGAIYDYVSYEGTIYKCMLSHNSSFYPEFNGTPDNYKPGGSQTLWNTLTGDEAALVTSASDWQEDRWYQGPHDFVVGYSYGMLYRFSDQTLKQPTERGGRTTSDYTFQSIKNGSVQYSQSGSMQVAVTPKYRDRFVYTFNPDSVGSNLFINKFTPQDGHFRFPVQTQAEDLLLEVRSESALPLRLLSAEFESLVVSRSKRYGA